MKYLVSVAAMPIALLMCSTALADDPCSGTTFPDGPTDFNVFFDAFSVADNDSLTCNVTIPVPLASDLFGVYVADYRGGTSPFGTATLTTVHNGVTATTILAQDVSYTVTQYVGTAPGGSIVDDLTLFASEDGSNDLETVDYALLGTVTLGDVEESVGGLADVEAGIVTHLNATAGLLTGADDAPDGANSVGLIGAIGSYTVGIAGHVAIDEGLSLDVGVASFEQGAGDLELSGLLAAAKLRYFAPDEGGMRWFGALGLTGAKADLDIARHYGVDYTDPDLADQATIASETAASLLTLSAEAGVLLAPDTGNSFRLSGEVAQSWVNVDGFVEAFSGDNLFPVSVPDRSAGYTTVKAKAGWTTALASTIDLTLSAALGQSFANDDFDAEVLYVGDVSVAGTSEGFAEAEARLGWAVAGNSDLDLFAKGSLGTASGSHVQVGTEYRLKF